MTTSTQPDATDRCTDLLSSFIQIATTQDEVNRRLVGLHWAEMAWQRTPVAGSDVVINYYDAMTDEAAELFRSAVPFKWWAAPSAVDTTNCIVELVDILHFWVSAGLVEAEFMQGAQGDTACYEAVALRLRDSWLRDQASQRNVTLREVVRTLQAAILMEADLDHLADLMWLAVRMLNVTPEAFASLYFAKAELNKFRKANGYKENTYDKIWTLTEGGPALEDNSHLVAAVTNFAAINGKPMTSSAIYQWLVDAYAKRISDQL